ncbi:uncharacterized protein LOC107472165 isoform X2 [Arachis duranensis]|uniref:Uncharacterized protein LOC107472165 isoform X2 n=1 Tax=Arachis duranensis TaxID=130453 RepID=A0A6P4C033_ARADU|nr:uncharacterized protein LOC107472165 isoform X2 [Arachis duranensis]
MCNLFSVMSLLEVIKNASINSKPLDSPLDYPIVLNPDTIIPNLKPEQEDAAALCLVKPLSGWKISQADAELIDIGKKFFIQLKAKLKSGNSLESDEFIGDLNSYLNSIAEKIGVSVAINPSMPNYTKFLIDKVGYFMGKDVVGVVLDVCISFDIWDIVEALIEHGVIKHSCHSGLVTRLIEKKRSDLICTCIKHAFDLGSSEILSILRYFLSPSKDAYDSMITVKKEWENQVQLAIDGISDSSWNKKNLLVAKEASVLLMVAYDGFSASEICLHYLLASSNFNDVLLSSSFSKLNGKELINLIRYLSKWLKKYERFPQAGPCPEAAAALGLTVCDWVPKLDDVVKFLGFVLDENFSSLVLHPEFHEQLRLIEEVVSSLTAESKCCFLMADVVNKLKMEVKGGNTYDLF